MALNLEGSYQHLNSPKNELNNFKDLFLIDSNLTKLVRSSLSSNRCSAFSLEAGCCFQNPGQNRKIHHYIRCFCSFSARRWFCFRCRRFKMADIQKRSSSWSKTANKPFQTAQTCALMLNGPRAEMTWTQHRGVRALCWRAVAWGNSWRFQSANILKFEGNKRVS